MTIDKWKKTIPGTGTYLHHYMAHTDFIIWFVQSVNSTQLEKSAFVSYVITYEVNILILANVRTYICRGSRGNTALFFFTAFQRKVKRVKKHLKTHSGQSPHVEQIGYFENILKEGNVQKFHGFNV